MARIATKECASRVGETVELAGWVDVRRDHGKLIFIDLRDESGVVQMVITPKNEALYKEADRVRPEWVIWVRGEVKTRPEGMRNEKLATGTVEIGVMELVVLNTAETPPFDIAGDGYDINEELRLEYRYLDLRRARLQKNLKARHVIIQYIRDFLTDKNFVEIETPILTKSTPEGARDYLVPSRKHPSMFFALPQSPQQYKQLLMIAGFERYFQIARCFRDEDTRGDRQPEFTQLDLEMSFVSQEDILALTEELYTTLVETLYPEKHISQKPWPRLTHKEVTEKYGTDKPDLRRDKNDPDELAFGFIIDFPMFEWRKEENRWDAVHHPFTKIKRDFSEEADVGAFIAKIKKDPARHTAEQYDFILNGYEISSGSIREHNPNVLEAVFEVMGHTKEEIHEKFGHLLRAFTFGVPPHGGIAPGIDRFIMILMNEPNIREVIAFPKTGDSRDPLMNAPSGIDKSQLDELGLEIKKHS